MPKIVINEYDLTKAGTSEYQNFSVVVPGFVSANYNEAVFDENDVYECTTQKDFENNVGKVAAEIVTTTTNTAAVAPSISCIIQYDPDRFDTDFTVVPATGNTPITYVYKKHDEFSDAFAALMEGNEPEETDWDTELSEVPAEFGVYYAVSNTSGIVGTLRDEINHYQAASAGDSGAAAVPTVTGRTMSINETSTPSYNTYYIIGDTAKGTPGQYTEERITHYGNQMAYELLGLGYTVLYKKIPYLDELPTETDKYETVTDSVTNTVYKRLKAENSALNVLSDADFWNCLRDKSTYDFRYVVTGMITGNDGANAQIKALAAHDNEILLDDATIDDGRGDCIALIDIDSTAYAGKTQIAAIPLIAKEAAKWESSYCAVFAPYVRYIMPDDPDYNNNNLFPAAFHYLACAMYSKNKNFNEWYANAGYTRGISKYTIESTGCKLGEMAVQSLEPRFMLKVGQEKKVDDTTKLPVTPTEYVAINTTVAVNLIIKIKDAYYLWGNRTCKKLGTRNAADGDLVAQHFLNIRQLSTTIKKQVYTTCRRLTFDPNSDKLWLDFQSLIRPTLDLMRGDNGIRDYMFVKDTTDRKALLKAKIRIVPIEAIEDFDIGIYLEDSLTDVSVTEG